MKVHLRVCFFIRYCIIVTKCVYLYNISNITLFKYQMKRSKTEIKLMETGKTLFWKYGLKRVTVEEICASAEISKMTFYRFFKNKLAIAMEILDADMQVAMIAYKELFNSDLNFVDKLEETIHMKIDAAKNISMEFLTDLMNYGGEEFEVFMTEKKMESMELTMGFLKKAQTDGDLRKDLNIDLIPILSESIQKLSYDPRLQAMYKTTEEIIKEIITFFFYGIVPHPKHP